MSLIISSNGDRYKLDEFYKSLVFQHIMDSDFLKEERMLLLVIYRQTLHYDKWRDTLSNYQLTQKTGLDIRKARSSAEQLEAKGILEVKRSKGGRGSVHDRSHQYELSTDFILLVFRKWLEIKEDGGMIESILV